ncbi:MAG: RNA polymerase factor sigma-54 [Pseudomonadota bacterium]
MKASLQLRFSQQLTMTPQLQQAIKLLQLSSQELEAQIIEALETNPLLEQVEPEPDEADTAPPEEQRTDEEMAAAAETEALAVEPTEWSQYDEPGGTRTAASGDGGEYPELAEGPDDLVDHLLWQLNLCTLSAEDRAIGVAIIQSIDEHGYLEGTSEDVVQCLAPEIEVELDEVEAIRHRIQRFDPVGVASLDLTDCLRVQLDALPEDTPARAVALRIVAEGLEVLARQDLDGLQRRVGTDRDTLLAAIELVRSLDPRPGRQVAGADTEYVRPDVTVERRGDSWQVRLHVNLRPQLGINSFYAGMIGSAGRQDADYLRGQLQEARWLLKSLETRNETILKVATAIVAHQQDFFDEGPEAMKPLVLREIAASIDMHESTVSRVTRGKYMATPRGIFEFKYFFSSHVGTADGGECSATAIQAMIRKLIDEEPPRKPLSDAKIAAILNDKGIDVARRTVAKYREGMNIASSSKRKRLF